MTVQRLRVLWIHHSAVVTEWRHGLVDALAELGVDATVVAAPRWNEGGALVELDAGPDERVFRAPTLGHHPYLFAYDPRPIRRALRAEPFDLVDAHEEPASIALAEILTLVDVTRRGLPVVCYSAQNLLKRYPLPFRALERRALRRIAGVHSCNADVERVLRVKGFAGEVTDAGLGVDVDMFSPHPGRVGVDSQRPANASIRVGYVGRIEESKGIFTLLAAVHTLTGVSLDFVGSGPDLARLADAIAARGMDAEVTVRGFAPHGDLPELYRSFDVVAVPSIASASLAEQFGRVVVEAMASGTPVIVSDAGALPQVAAGAGIVVPQSDAKALANAIVRVRDDPSTRTALTEAGLARARQFSWEAVASRRADLYRRVTRR